VNKQMSTIFLRTLAAASLMGLMATEGEPKSERVSSTTLSGVMILGTAGDWNCSHRGNNSSLNHP